MKKFAKTISLIIGAILLCSTAYGDYSLSVLPFQGGNSLRFGRVTYKKGETKEVKIRITSDVSEQYQVRQRILSPLKNSKGDIIPEEAISFHTLRGSNSYGSLYQDMPHRLTRSESVLYTSSPNGNGDSFTIVYSVNPDKINYSGEFRGQILYRLVPLSGTGSEQQSILNIYLDSRQNFEIDINTSSQSSRKLELSSSEKTGYINLEIKGQTGSPYQITQQMQQPIKNRKGEIISSDILNFSISAQKGESFYPSPAALTQSPETIYTSNKNGEGENVIVKFAFSEKDDKEITAGEFQSQIKYKIETPSSVLEHKFVDLELDIEPVFELEIGTRFNQGLYFRNIEPDKSPIQKEINIKVKSNLQRPYSVIQNLKKPLTNSKGESIPVENLEIKVEKGKNSPGNSLFSDFTPLQLGNNMVFSSDTKGNPTEFEVIYSLKVTPETPPGDYQANISYSLIER